MLFSCIITLGLFLLINFVVGFSPLLVLLTFNPTFFILLMLGISTVIGTVLANAFGRYYLRPLKRIIAATKDEVCILDPSWTSKKFKQWEKEGLVRTEGTLVYTTPEILHNESKTSSPPYYIFRRK